MNMLLGFSKFIEIIMNESFTDYLEMTNGMKIDDLAGKIELTQDQLTKITKKFIIRYSRDNV